MNPPDQARPMKSWYSDPLHASLRTGRDWEYSRYVHGDYGGWLLPFTKAWGEANLPPQSTSDGFVLTYLDSQTGLTYQHPIYVAYEHEPHYDVLDAEDNVVRMWSLMSYFYSMHHCPCHRKQDMHELGVETDDECEGHRFQIESIVAPDMPELILYSETLDDAELDRRLEALRP